MTPPYLPVRREPFQHQLHKPADQVGVVAVGQDQQPRIIRQQRPSPTEVFGRPADERVPIFEVKSNGTPRAHRQPLAAVHNSLAQVLPHQADGVQLMMLCDGRVATGHLLRTGQQPEVAMLQNVLFLGS